MKKSVITGFVVAAISATGLASLQIPRVSRVQDLDTTSAVGSASTADVRREIFRPENVGRQLLSRASTDNSLTEMGRERSGANHASRILEKNENGLYRLPLSVRPSAADGEAGLFTIIDHNNNGNTWHYYDYCEEFSMENAEEPVTEDDWLFLPAFEVEDTDVLHEFSFSTYTYMSDTPPLEIYAGESLDPSGMRKIGDVVVDGFNEQRCVFHYVPEVKGCNTLAVKSIAYITAVYDFAVRKTDIGADAPAAVGNLDVEAAPNGELSAIVSFDMPEITIRGDRLPSGADYEAVVTTSVDKSTVTGKPGERVSATVGLAQGLNDISVRVEEGMTADVCGVFGGIDVPMSPTVISTEVFGGNMSVAIMWEVTGGVHGGYVDANNLTYTLEICDRATMEWHDVAVTKENGANVTIENDSPQMAYNFYLVAEDAMGNRSDGTRFDVAMGTPYLLPMKERLIWNERTYEPYMAADGSEYDAIWVYTDTELCDPYAADLKGQVMCCKNYDEVDALGGIVLPKFSTAGAENVLFTFETFFYEGLPDLSVYVRMPGVEREVLITANADSFERGYHKVSCLLPREYVGQDCVEISIDARFHETEQFFLLPSYSITDTKSDDLAAISADGPKKPHINVASEYFVCIENAGYDPVPASEVGCSLVKDGNVVATLTPQGMPDKSEMAVADTRTYSFSLTPDPGMVGLCEVVFEILRKDMVDGNNIVSMPVEVVLGENVVVTDLCVIQSDEKSVTIEWSRPLVASGLLDFEEEIPFMQTEGIGGFRNIDNDGFTTSGYAFPYIPWADAPAAFVVWNSDIVSQAAYNNDIYPASGKQWIAALSPSWEDNADDWLISPEISGGSTISFDMSAMFVDTEYLEVLVSSTDDDIDSFRVLKEFTFKGEEWNKYEVKLPEDARYFALRYCSPPMESCGVMIDNIEYVSAMASASFIGYDIYRNDVMLAECAAPDCRYMDSDLPEGEEILTYQVVPVYILGGEIFRGTYSNKATNQTVGISEIIIGSSVRGGKGCVVIEGFEGMDAMVYNAAGMHYATAASLNGHKEIFVQPGIYVVKIGNMAFKVVVK